ncbi:MAG: hypothetical protein PHO37_01330 [Kiritimatiellae bacterium]|nr:hypothetical protein [Kiritimatiellia bacterium]
MRIKKILVIFAITLSVGLCQTNAQIAEPVPAAGIELPMQNYLSAAAGMVELFVTVPEDWPSKAEQTLFHVGEQAHTHVTLFFRNGNLIAVYKADKEHHASIIGAAARQWRAGEQHRVQFQWRAEDGKVAFYLRLDDQLVGGAHGAQIQEWPAALYLGRRGNRQPWRGSIDRVSLRADPPPLPEYRPGTRTISVDASRVEGPLYNFWSIANYTSQEQFTDPKYQAQQRTLRPGMRSVNCVRLLGGRNDRRNRWFLGADEKGAPRFDFTGLIASLQGIIEAGYTPRIVLDNVPLEMSGDVKMEKYGNTSPPQKYALWEGYVEGALRAMVAAFGQERVAGWRFRVGTEPDLYPGHWQGTQGQYEHHYLRTVAAVQRVIPKPEIGFGNIIDIKHGKWGLELVDFAATNNLPMSFLSSSWYGRVGEDSTGFEQNVKAMRSRLSQYERFRKVPLEIAEFGILQDEYNQRLWSGDATEWGASWYAGIAAKVYALNVAELHQWSTTTLGLPHPRTHIHTLLEPLVGGQRLAVTLSDVTSQAHSGAIAAQRGGSIYVLLYNHRPLRTPSVRETVHLKVSDSRMKSPEPWQLSEWRVDRDHGVFIHALTEDCGQAGLTPLPNSAVLGGDIHRRWGAEGMEILRANFNRYQKLASLPQTITGQNLTVENGSVTMTIEMPGHSVRLLKLTPAGS